MILDQTKTHLLGDQSTLEYLKSITGVSHTFWKDIKVLMKYQLPPIRFAPTKDRRTQNSHRRQRWLFQEPQSQQSVQIPEYLAQPVHTRKWIYIEIVKILSPPQMKKLVTQEISTKRMMRDPSNLDSLLSYVPNHVTNVLCSTSITPTDNTDPVLQEYGKLSPYIQKHENFL